MPWQYVEISYVEECEVRERGHLRAWLDLETRNVGVDRSCEHIPKKFRLLPSLLLSLHQIRLYQD